jgi:hypothetical protein
MPLNYKPIKAEYVAKSMVEYSKKSVKGFKIYNFEKMIK